MKAHFNCLHRSRWWLLLILSLVTGTAFGAMNSVVLWGAGQTNVPAGLTNVATMADGIAVLRDGRIRTWGDLGSYTNVPSSATNVVALEGNINRWLAIRRDGSVISRGGQILASNSVSVAMADSYGAGSLRSDGFLQWWDGFLDFPKTTSNIVALTHGGYASPTILYSDGTIWPLVSGLSNVVMMDKAHGCSVWLRNDGTAASYAYGMLNLQAASNVIAVAAGGNHGLALRRDGTVAAWGDNSWGQTDVPAGLSNVAAIVAGDLHSMALKSDGTVIAWGNNSSGQTNVPPGITNAAAIFARGYYSAAIVGESPPTLLTQPPDVTVWSGRSATFTVKAIGSPPLPFQWQFNGEAIEGATNAFYRIDRTAPADSGVYEVVVSNARGTAASRGATLLVLPDPYFALDPTNQTLLLGQTATFRALAIGSEPVSYQWFFEGERLTAETNTILSLTNTGLAQAGRYWVVASDASGVRTSSVAILKPLVLAAWGDIGLDESPAGILNIAGIASGGNNNFLIKPDGTGLFWGGDDYVWPGMQLGGYVSNIVALAPGHEFVLALLTNGSVVARGLVDISHGFNVASLSNVVGISAGYYHALALMASGGVVAWGDDWEGSTQVPAGLTDVVSISAGGYHSMALRANGSVVAWGYNHSGQADIPPGLTNVVAIAGGGHHSLALDGDGRVVAWGSNGYGQTNVPVGLSNVIAIAAGFGHSLALRADGTVVGWGDNSDSQVAIPTQLHNVVAITAGFDHNMALLGEGLVAPTVQFFNATRSNNVFSLHTETVRGRSYYLQFRDSLTDSRWRLLPPVPGDGGVKILHESAAATSQRFYRVWQKP